MWGKTLKQKKITIDDSLKMQNDIITSIDMVLLKIKNDSLKKELEMIKDEVMYLDPSRSEVVFASDKKVLYAVDDIKLAILNESDVEIKRLIETIKQNLTLRKNL